MNCTDGSSGSTLLGRLQSASDTIYPVGRRLWRLDGEACSQGAEHEANLTLTACGREGQFTCDDGQCIHIHQVRTVALRGADAVRKGAW